LIYAKNNQLCRREFSIKFAKIFLRQKNVNYSNFSLAIFDESHGGGYAGLVCVYEHKTPEPSDKTDVGNLPITRLEARVSFAGKKDETGVVKHTDLSRLHLSVFAKRMFAPKNPRKFFKGRDANAVAESINVSYRWCDEKSLPLRFGEEWEKYSCDSNDDGLHQVSFHPIRSTYFVSVPLSRIGELGQRYNPAFPISSPCSPFNVLGQNDYSDFNTFLQKIFGEIGGVPVVGLDKIRQHLSNFPIEPLKFRAKYHPEIEKVPQYLFGQVLPFLKKFVEFQG